MNKSIMIKSTLVVIVMLVTMSCNSVESDAEKAASLINKSIEQSQHLKFENAEKNYLKAQEIIDKYVGKDNKVEFYEHFANYRDKEKKQNAK